MSAVKPVLFEIDAEDLLGQPVDDEALLEKIGQRALDMIKERTQKGLDKYGEPFHAYSEAYINSLAFKAGGKSPKEVNMTLFGDMLGLMDIVEKKDSKIILGWKDEKENAKAFRHTTGDLGMPKRDFFGLTKEQEKTLRDEFRDAVSSSTGDGDQSESQASAKDLEILNFIRELQRGGSRG